MKGGPRGILPLVALVLLGLPGGSQASAQAATQTVRSGGSSVDGESEPGGGPSANGGSEPGGGGPSKGWSSAALYNQANAYARAGKAGLAVLNYERASLLSPGDPDIEANLHLVRRSAGLEAETTNRWTRAVARLSPGTASWIGLAGLILVAAAVLAGLPRARRHGPHQAAAISGARRVGGTLWVRGALIVGAALIVLTLVSALVTWPRLHEAIVVARTAPVRIAPAPMGDTLFALEEAEAVRIVGEHDGFVLVRDSAGRTGWVWHTDLAPVVP